MTQLCAITGPVRDRAGNLLANQELRFFYRGGVVGSASGALVPKVVTAITSAAGQLSVSLYSGLYRVEADTENSRLTFNIGVPDAASATFSDLIEENPAITSDLLAQTVAARDEARDAAQSAADDAVSALRLVTPQQFNAVGDGVTDDSAAFQAMFDHVMAQTGGWPEIYIPAGRYLIGTRITKTTLNPNDQMNTLKVRGAGASSVIINSNSSGFFRWTTTDRSIRAHFSDFAVRLAAGGNNGSIIYLEVPAGGLSRTHDATFERLEMQPADRTVDYADNFITAKGLYWATLRECTLSGPYGPGVSVATTNLGTCGVNFDECFGYELHGSKIWGCQLGFSHVVAVTPGGEGGNIRDCVILSHRGALIDSGAGQEVGFQMDATHMNCVEYNLKIIGKKMGFVANSLFYARDNAPCTDIILEDVEDFTVSNMRFHFSLDVANRVNIDVDGNCRNISLEHNKHRDTHTCMRLRSGATNIEVINPWFDRSDADIVREIFDEGAVNLSVTRAKPYRLHWRRNAGQSVANATATVVTWDTELEDNGFNLTPGAIITIPANKGIRRVRVTSNVEWQNNSTGNRQAWHSVGGARVAGQTADLTQVASALSHGNLTSVLQVTDGSVIRLSVQQSSGGSLNVGGGATWIVVEEI